MSRGGVKMDRFKKVPIAEQDPIVRSKISMKYVLATLRMKQYKKPLDV